MESFTDFLNNQGGSGSLSNSGLQSFSDFLKTAPPIQTKPSFFSRAVNATKNAMTNFGQKINDYTNASTDQVANFGDNLVNAFKNPQDTTQKVIKSFSTPFTEASDKAANSLIYLSKHLSSSPTGALDLTNPEVIAHTANFVTGFAQSLLTPLTGGFHIAEKIPVAKQVADALNLPLTVIDMGNSYANGQAFDWLEKSGVISPETKSIIQEPIKEVTGLAAQIFLGGKIMDKISEYAKEGKPITEKNAQTMVSELPPPPTGPGGSSGATAELPTFNQFLEGSGTKTPSNSTVAKSLPGAATQEPSFQTSNVKGDVVESQRYTSSSHLINLSDLPIQDKVSTIRENSQQNSEPFKNDIQKATGIQPDVRVKSESSLTGKIGRYEARGKSAGEISDGLAGKVETNLGDVTNQEQNIKNNFNVKESQNYFDKPNEWGYKGINMRVELPGGSPAEVQIHTPESWKAAKAVHHLYENWRDVDVGKLTPEQEKAYNTDKALSNEISQRINPDQKTSGVASSIEAKAIEKGLTKDLGGLAGYDPITIKEQSRLVDELIKNNLEDAKSMIRGDKPLPDNLRGAALIKGLEDYAISKGDVSLLKDLADSPLVSETSRHAQELRLLAERNPESPVSIMKAVKDAREKAVEKKTNKKITEARKSVVDEIKKEIKANASKRPTWEAFIESIQCGY